MKKICVIVLLLCSVMFVSSQAHAQAPVRENIVKINPLSLFLLTFNGSYERVVSNSASVQLGVLYTGFNIQGTSFNGLAITPEVRFYLSNARQAPEGFHVSPFLRYQNFSIDVSQNGEEGSAKISSFGGGVLAGYQWLLGSSDRVSLDLFAGPKYSSSSAEYSSSVEEEDVAGSGQFGGLWLRAGMTLGVAF